MPYESCERAVNAARYMQNPDVPEAKKLRFLDAYDEAFEPVKELLADMPVTEQREFWKWFYAQIDFRVIPAGEV